GVDSVSRTDEVGFMIFVDDGSSAAHSDASTLPYAVARGNFVEDVMGPLAYTFDNYKIEPLATPQIYGEVMVLPTLPEAGPNQLNIATFNAENLFDTRDPHPSSPERPSRAEYAVRLQKLADTIEAMGAPTVIGLQEVENIGVLEDLLELEILAGYGYVPYLIEGFDSRGIDVGYLVRSDRAAVELVTNEDAPEALFSRPPLLLKVVVAPDSGLQTVYFLNNHFLSLSGGEEATEPVRTAQAAWNVDRMQAILADEPDAQVVVMGDLNSFYQTLPVDTLQAAGLHHAYEFFGDDEPLPYTYIFEGRTQTLDHILLSEGLFARVTAVNALHLNANYPIADAEDTTAQRSSDHDPLVIMLTWE
ncbi:MAG: endonuclease/exonuclease/phosphatase family protein, partial [Anaerolineales bacterium]|nr:endonuclease/exonuclease/phosphatase family protein [Anaerolineales bacterium]